VTSTAPEVCMNSGRFKWDVGATGHQHGWVPPKRAKFWTEQCNASNLVLILQWWTQWPSLLTIILVVWRTNKRVRSKCVGWGTSFQKLHAHFSEPEVLVRSGTPWTLVAPQGHGSRYSVFSLVSYISSECGCALPRPQTVCCPLLQLCQIRS
jgi:hypothetical protein